MYRSTAMTAATPSPTYRTLSTASGYCAIVCGPKFMHGFILALQSSPVTTAMTPGIFNASVASILTIVPCATGLL